MKCSACLFCVVHNSSCPGSIGKGCQMVGPPTYARLSVYFDVWYLHGDSLTSTSPPTHPPRKKPNSEVRATGIGIAIQSQRLRRYVWGHSNLLQARGAMYLGSAAGYWLCTTAFMNCAIVLALLDTPLISGSLDKSPVSEG